MFTVIILNRRSSDLLKDYRFLFKPFLDNGSIAFCDWNEAGTDVRSSVPGIYNLIKGKKEWRAMVINTDSVYDYRDCHIPNKYNPFDYSALNSGIPEESDIPMIRLTHIIGGYTAVSKKEFEKGFEFFDEEKGKTVRVPESEMTDEKFRELSDSGEELIPIYIEKKLPDEIKKREDDLRDKYSFSDIRPYEIQLVATRRRIEDNEVARIEESWKNHLEMTSSSFWERNKYPNNTRFLFYDVVNTDNSLYVKQLTEFWLSVLTLATNKLQASSLQAYRLYRMGIGISNEELEGLLNNHLNKLNSVYSFIKEQMTLKPEYTFDEDEEVLPVQSVPVSMDFYESDDLFIDCSSVGLSNDCPMSELIFWNNQIKQKSNNIDRFLKQPRRSIDKAADYLKAKSETYTGEDYSLDRFQLIDLNEDMLELKSEIVSADTGGTIDRNELNRQIEELSKEVKKEISLRMRRRTVIISGLIALLLGFGGFIPYIISSAENGLFAFLSSLILTAVVMAVMAIGGLAVLFIQRLQIIRQMKRFNELMRKFIGQVFSGSAKFEKFFTDICTYMKGQSILDGIKRKKKNSFTNAAGLNNHKTVTLETINRDNEWIIAYDLTRREEMIPNAVRFFDPEIIPRDNNIYYFPANSGENDIPFNNTGDFVTAPYKFVNHFWVQREDVFDEVEE